jgi:hypothetical protein
MKYVVTKRPKQALIKRFAQQGHDWGVDRKLLATGPNGQRLIWWTGHSTWICVGQSGHVPGELMVDQTSGHDKHLNSEEAGTRLARVLKSDAGRAFIREHFIDDDEVIAAIDPRGTIDVREAK